MQSNIPSCFTIKATSDRLDCNFNNPQLVEFEKKLLSKPDTIDFSIIRDITDGNHEETEYVDDGFRY